MTFLELVNKIMSRLRERNAASTDAGYAALAGQIVNEAKREIEDMGPWYALRTTINKTLTADTDTVSLTDETNERSYLLRDENLPQAFVTTVDLERRLQVIPQSRMDALRALYTDQQNDTPSAVSFSRSASGVTAELWPTPDAAYTVRFVFVVPQDDLTDDDTLSVPSYPVQLLAIAMATEERGDELGTPQGPAYARAEQAKWDAANMDFLTDPMTVEPE